MDSQIREERDKRQSQVQTSDLLPRIATENDGIDGLLTRGLNQGKCPAEADRETGGEAEDAGARAGEHTEQTERGERLDVKQT